MSISNGLNIGFAGSMGLLLGTKRDDKSDSDAVSFFTINRQSSFNYSTGECLVPYRKEAWPCGNQFRADGVISMIFQPVPEPICIECCEDFLGTGILSADKWEPANDNWLASIWFVISAIQSE